MATYVVMEPPATDAAERAVLVRDGFALIAFLVPPLWLLWHRLWVEAMLALAASIALATLGEQAGFGAVGAGLSLLVSLLVGFEGQALRIARLRRNGWSEWGALEARNSAEAEIRYCAAHGETANAPPRAIILPGTDPVRPAPSGPALGLFGYPGRS
ncbi:MAG: DUF2628 domain-containing protein [Hyphomicrobiales bacterium]|nr:DUF2628 domain-containing protein [Hyphomicrobiales bacterium]